MSRERELVKNTAVVAVGRVCTKLLSFFLLPLYTAVLTTRDYGIVDLFNTYTALLLPLVVFQVEDALFRFAVDFRTDEGRRDTVVSTALCFCGFQAVAFTLLYLAVQAAVSIPYRWYLWGNILLSIFFGPLLQLTRGLGHVTVYAFASFLNAAVSVALNVLLVLGWKMGAEGLFLTAILSNGISIGYLLHRERIFKMVRVRAFDRGTLKEMLSYSLPLVPNTLAWWVIGASDKTVVSWFLGVAENGILSVSQKFSTMYTTFYSIFNLAWTENAALYCNDEDNARYYSSIIETAFRLLAGVCLGIIAVVALVFPVLIHPKFDASYYQIPIYMLSALIYASIGIYSVVYIAYKKTGKVARTSLLAAGVNLVVNCVLIRRIGLYAASISSVVAYGVLFVSRYSDIQKYMKIRMSRKVVWSAAAFLAVDFVCYYLRNPWISGANLAVITVYAVILNRQMLRNIWKLLLEKMGRR